MRVQVEFLGLSRIITREKEITLELQKGTSFRDLVRLLGDRYPALIPNVIQADRETLQSPNIFNLNARKMIQVARMKEGPSDGDRVILMSMSAGG